MGKQYDEITAKQIELIEAAQLFFVASVDPELSAGPHGVGPLNVSPKGATQLVVLGPKRVAYLDYPGSGNETARHAEAGGPVTVMVMSFGPEDPAIVRLYGKASILPAEGDHQVLSTLAPELAKKPRQIVEVEVEKTQTSCGYGVPIFDFVGQRPRASRGRRFKEPKRDAS
jgi:pyridoxamine 5'-phosphate oxidase-like protein